MSQLIRGTSGILTLLVIMYDVCLIDWIEGASGRFRNLVFTETDHPSIHPSILHLGLGSHDRTIHSLE